MKRGLVIGKFLPVHEGHVALIRFAASQVDHLIVSMSFTDDDPIPPEIRERWLRTLFTNDPKIEIKTIADDFDEAALPLEKRTEIWARKLRSVYPAFAVVFSSEAYGAPLAMHLGAKHVPFDPDRQQVPVSGTKIRTQPMQYWAYIPTVVRPYFVKKICFYGAESTGKSTLATLMAEKYQTVFVPEVAREMLTSNDFTVQDIIRIGEAHYQRIIELTQHANKLLFCDTDAITTQIYSAYYLGVVPDALYDLEERVRYDHYFLMDIDVPWVADGLRDLPHKRREMFELFKSALDHRNIRYTLVRGNWSERERLVFEVIEGLFTE
jgi:HTH-type transcriptional regulator, transcriptional repressor of NAD biosynthesis genes